MHCLPFSSLSLYPFTFFVSGPAHVFILSHGLSHLVWYHSPLPPLPRSHPHFLFISPPFASLLFIMPAYSPPATSPFPLHPPSCKHTSSSLLCPSLPLLSASPFPLPPFTSTPQTSLLPCYASFPSHSQKSRLLLADISESSCGDHDYWIIESWTN